MLSITSGLIMALLSMPGLSTGQLRAFMVHLPVQVAKSSDTDNHASEALGDVFLSNEVGMSMQLPANAVVVTRQVQPNAFFLVRDGKNSPQWSLRLESLQTDDPTAERLIQRLMLAQGQGKASPDIEILSESPFSTQEASGHLTWVRETLPDDSQVVFGWLVFPQGRIAGKLHYIVATAVTVPAAFAHSKSMLEKSFKTIALRGPEAAMDRATEEANATSTFLKNLSEADLRALDGYSSVRRAFRPALGDQAEQEVAYTIFSIQVLPMGSIHNGRPESDYTPEEQEEGILVKVHSRVIADRNRDIYLDMLGLYWMAFDLSHESWTAQVTRRQGAATRIEKEFGFRPRISLGQPRPRVVVIKQDDEINLREPYEWEVPEPWMPRPMTWILGHVLPRNGPIALSYACIDHRQKIPTLGTRRDEWSEYDPQSSQWRLQTWLDDSGLPTTGIYDIDGMLEQRNADGLVIETSSPEAIREIWEKAGLRTR